MHRGLEAFAQVRIALAQRVADARFLAARRGNVSLGDDDETMMRAAPGVEMLPAVFHLTYENARGEVSERVVTIRRIARHRDQMMLHGYCHLRGRPRCFATDRIAEVYDQTTGEVHGDARRFFSDHPLFTDPREPEQAALADCQHEINLLTVVGAADGLFDPDEQDVLLLHVFNRCDHPRLDEELIKQRLALVAPDRVAFRKSLRQMRQFKAGDATALLRTLRKMVDADGHLAPEEIGFVTEIESYLRA